MTVRAEVRPQRLRQLLDLLAEIGGEGADNEHLPFRELAGVHFARLLVLPREVDFDGAVIAASLLYMSDVDGSVDAHLADLVDRARPGVDAIFGHCRDYPGDPGDRRARIRWLREHLVAGATVYIHTVGRGLTQVREEARLRAEIEDFLDRPGSVPAGATGVEVHRRVRAFVRSRPDLRWALRPVRGPGLARRIRKVVNLVGLPALLLVLSPVLLPAAVLLLLRVRWLERSDIPDDGPVSPAHLADIERFEDHVAHNPFTAVGMVKPGVTRRSTMTFVLAALGYAMRHLYHRDNLAGVRTIHFARWLPIDGGRRVIFASNYDGSVESYMDDFIDRLAWGLNAVFSNGVGYPATRWLLTGGARDERAFKHYLRRHQVPTQVWYSAYEDLPARNIDDTARLRRELAHPLTEPAASAWLSLL